MSSPRENHGPEDDRPLDEATAALRDAGAVDAASVPPELRRATLQGLWAADAQRYEVTSRRRAKAFQWVLGAAAAVTIIGAGAFLLILAAISRPQDGHWSRRVVATPPPATRPVEPPVMVGEPGNPPTMMPAGVVVHGRVDLAGIPPPSQYVDLSAVPECRMCHPDGLLEESVVVDGNGRLANVVLSIARADGQPLGPLGPARTGPAVLDQQDCRFIPHVMPMMVGQPLLVRNRDRFLHNTHSLALANPAFNFGQPNFDAGRLTVPMTTPEQFRIKCDVHPWMAAYIHVFDHPYFATSAADGTFQIRGSLPDGAYTLTAWHEVFGEQTTPIQIAGGRPVVANLTFTAP